MSQFSVIPWNARSWLEVSSQSDFSLQNLPFGIFTSNGRTEPRVGLALGDWVVDTVALFDAGLLAQVPGLNRTHLLAAELNALLSAGSLTWRGLRAQVAELFTAGNSTLLKNSDLHSRLLVKQSEAKMRLPTRVSNYVDFYSSREHASNVGAMFRDPQNPLLPNWLHIPIGYNGRSSSIIPSGVPFKRPMGQLKADTDPAPIFAPTKQLDFELEMAFITGKETALGETISAQKTDDYIFGLALLNDWSARDVQRWEYVPLGPFLAKTFATSLSPWIVTLDALQPFRVNGPEQTVPVLPYLQTAGPQTYDIHLEVLLQSERMSEPLRISRTNFKYMYWSMAQQLAHLASNGTNVDVGDVYGSGTISGPTPDSYGSMLELCWKGTKPIALPDGSQRKFIEDGDTVIMKGWAEKDGVRIGFGEVRTQVLPAG
ncbi:fumarylacetoacetase [bacterium]|nr:fumarylacetoacetase [bacterium]